MSASKPRRYRRICFDCRATSDTAQFSPRKPYRARDLCVYCAVAPGGGIIRIIAKREELARAIALPAHTLPLFEGLAA